MIISGEVKGRQKWKRGKECIVTICIKCFEL